MSTMQAESAAKPDLSAVAPAVAANSLFTGVLGGLEHVSTNIGDYRALDDEALLAANRDAAAAAHAVAARQALVAAVIAERSGHELGRKGLAQREGFRTPEQFIKKTTGTTALTAIGSLRTGAMMAEIADAGKIDPITGEVSTPTQPWLAPVVTALTGGGISVEAAGAIARGLGRPNSAATPEHLELAAAELCVEASGGTDPDALYKEARAKRDELDVGGVKLREAERHAAREWTMFTRPDGMLQIKWVLAPEDGALVKEAHDRLVSPKLGQVRFVSEERKAHAEAIKNDGRTPAQLASDGMLHLILAGADADSSQMLGSGAPVIRITTMREAGPRREAEAAFAPARPIGRIDGQAEPVSAATVDRLRCTGSVRTISFDQNGFVTETESEQRLFSTRQREALAAKFGGCMDPDCDRPPSWTEAHHIQFFKRDKGKTVLGNGILLCKYHHLKYHNENFEITVNPSGEYWLIPPPEVDRTQTPRHMRLKARNVSDLRRTLAGQRQSRPS
jgi:hypothetical protein